MAGAGINSVNVGRDVTVNLVSGSTGIVPLNITTSFDAKPTYDKRTSRPMNGRPIFLPIPAGWDGTFELDRQDPTLDDFFAALDAGYFNGQGVQASTINETIVNAVDGSVSVYQYVGVMLTFDQPGKKAADDMIKMTVGFQASDRIKLQ
jgi:hypothetical protein